MCPPVGIDYLAQIANWTGRVPSCVPTDDISQSAFKHAASNVHPLILAHSIRVFLLAQKLSQDQSGSWHQGDRLPVLFSACIFHDIGTSATYASQPLRFEIEGADAAQAFLAEHHISREDQEEVWRAIALHDTPQVAERFPGPGLVKLTRLAVMADFKRKAALGLFDPQDVANWERQFPRGEIEKVLGDAVVEQAIKCPDKAPAASWPGGMYHAYLTNPDWTGVNKAF